MTIQKITPGIMQRFGLVQIEATSTGEEMRYSIVIPLNESRKEIPSPICSLPISSDTAIHGIKIGYFDDKKVAEQWLDDCFKDSIIA